jgi:hypothetical protein
LSDSPSRDGGAAAPDAARLTPYELVFAAPDFPERVFPTLRDDAQLLGLDPLEPDEFQRIPSLAAVLRELVPPEATAEALEQYQSLLFHAFNFWRSGEPVYLVERAVARYLVEAAPTPAGWELTLPHSSLYIQLPSNLFWGSITPESTPEPVDGLFVTSALATDGLGKPFRRLDLLVVLGIRRDRAGFSIIPFSTETGPGIAAAWAEAAGREGGTDFENILPGGEIQGLYSILTAVEVLKLLGRVLWYLDVNPDEVAVETAPERRDEDRPASPPFPRIPYYRVSLGRPGQVAE